MLKPHIEFADHICYTHFDELHQELTSVAIGERIHFYRNLL